MNAEEWIAAFAAHCMKEGAPCGDAQFIAAERVKTDGHLDPLACARREVMHGSHGVFAPAQYRM